MFNSLMGHFSHTKVEVWFCPMDVRLLVKLWLYIILNLFSNKKIPIQLLIRWYCAYLKICSFNIICWLLIWCGLQLTVIVKRCFLEKNSNNFNTRQSKDTVSTKSFIPTMAIKEMIWKPCNLENHWWLFVSKNCIMTGIMITW